MQPWAILSDEYLIISDPRVCGGKPVVGGTRVPVQYVLEVSDKGYEARRIHDEYPTGPKALITELLKFIADENAPVV